MISLFDGLFLGALAFVAFYLYMTWNFNYWKKRGIDSDDKPNFLFGSMTDAMLGKRAMGEVFCKLYEKFPGKKVVGFYKFRTPALIVRDPEIVKRILVTDFNFFPNNDVTLDEDADPIMGANIFVLKDELWKKKRALITPAFTAGKIKAIYSGMQEVAKELVKYLQQQPEEIVVKPVMSRYTSEIVAKCALGIDGNNFKHSTPEMHELGKLIWEPDFVRNFKIMAMFTMPQVTKLLRLKLVPEKVSKFFNTMMRDVIVYRQENNLERNDLVQYFIDIKRKTLEVAKGNLQSDILTKVYTDEDILSGCITFFVEGYETTALTLTHVLYNLAMHKDVQETLRAEIDEVLKEGELTFEKLNAMNYLQCVYAESTRVLPVLYHMQKICAKRYEMNIGKPEPLVIEKGTSIVLPIYTIQRDPVNWEDPTTFKPERFLDKEAEAAAKAKGIYLPFSDGPRMCPGMRIAVTMVKLALVHILSKLEILPTSKTPKVIEPDPNYFMVTQKGGIYLRFVERSN